MLARPWLVASLALALGFDPEAAPTGVELHFTPEPGLALRKDFRYVDASESRVVRSSMGGNEQEADQLQENEGQARLVVVDRYLEVEGGRVLAFERTYEEFEQDSLSTFEHEGGSMETEALANNELDGLTVRFTWNEELAKFVATCDEADDEWLEELEADRDYATLLSDGEVDEGDEWKIPAEEFLRLTHTVQDLPLDWEFEQDGEAIEELEEIEDGPEPELDEESSGEITARFEGLREVDGRELAVIVLEGEFEATSRASGSTAGEEHGDSSWEHETRAEFAVSGECLWDPAAGRLHALTVELEMKGDAEQRSTFEMAGNSFDLETESELEGRTTIEVRFEQAE